jgi:hypothetical protein
VTAPRPFDDGRASAGGTAPTPRLLLLIPYLLIFVAAALTPDSELSSNQGDVGLYLEKATQLAGGLVPYRDFPFEYPPAALVPMAAPYLAWPFGTMSVEIYKWLFAGWEAILMLALGFVLTRIVRLGGDAAPGIGVSDRGTAARLAPRLRNVALRLTLLTAGAALALTFRFDLFPAFLVMVALWAALAGRPGVAGVAVAIGVLAKLYPLAVIPALAIPWLFPVAIGRLTRYVAAVALTILLVMLPFVALAGSDAFAFLAYQAQRGLQVESIGGGLAVLGGLVGGSPVPMSFGFSAVQVEGSFAAAWLAAHPVLTVLGFGLLGWLGWRRIQAERAAFGAVTARTIVALATASVLVLLATSKVYSIQYVVWIVPFAALLCGRRLWVAAALVALTMPIHPLLYGDLVEQQALPILVLNLRNGLLLALLIMVLADLAGRVARPAGLEPTTFRSAT